MATNDKKHEESLKALGRFGAMVVVFFVAIYVAVYLNITYSPEVPWFIVVIIVGGYYVVPKAKSVMSMFDDKQPK
jgi:hypothetical protein